MSQQAQASETPPKQRGCFFYGFIFTLIFIGLVAAAISYTSYSIYQFAKENTDTKAMKLPKVDASDKEIAETKTKIHSFAQDIEAGTSKEALKLTAKDINILILEDPKLKGKAHVEIKDGKIEGQVSIPLKDVEKFKDRFLNASAVFDASLKNGVLIVTIQSAKVKGKPLPEWIMKKLRKQNLAQDVYKDPEKAKAIRKFESIEVKDDVIVIKGHKKQ